MSTPDRSDLTELFSKTVYSTEYGNVHMGQELPVGLIQWMDAEKKTTLAILGAENPQGVNADQAMNNAAHQRLLAYLAERSLIHTDTLGHCADWSERHASVLGLTVENAQQIATEFDQAAIVWCERDGLATLVWCVRSLLLVLALTLGTHATTYGQDCLDGLLPIGEVDLLEPGDRWPDRVELEDSVRTRVLARLGFVDSTGQVLDRVDVFSVYTCNGSNGLSYVAYYLNGHVDEHDDYLYLATHMDDRIVARVLIAQLQTTCEFTYLRACSGTSTTELLLTQLEHRFSCETQEFLTTQYLPSISVVLRTDGTFDESVLDQDPTTD